MSFYSPIRESAGREGAPDWWVRQSVTEHKKQDARVMGSWVWELGLKCFVDPADDCACI
jgi:hypothetical protein